MNDRESLDTALEAVRAERARQDAKWGRQQHPDGTGTPGDRELSDRIKQWCDDLDATGDLTWRDIATEEVAEANAESDLDLLAAEVTQTAAVYVAWLEHINARRRAQREGQQ